MGISFLISLNNPLFKNIPHVRSFWHFVIWLTREDRATQPLDAGRLSFAIIASGLPNINWKMFMLAEHKLEIVHACHT